MYADRQWQAEMLYGNTVKIFIPDGDVTIVVRRKEEVCIIITHCFGRVIYIKMCIAHVEISFYFTPGINFSSGEKIL